MAVATVRSRLTGVAARDRELVGGEHIVWSLGGSVVVSVGISDRELVRSQHVGGLAILVCFAHRRIFADGRDRFQPD
jgi:hypothetical protein